VVETAIGRTRRLLVPVGALLALGVLAAMVVSGQLREDKQFVKFTPAGVMTQPPAEIDGVEVRTAAGRWRFVRAADGWRDGARALPSDLAAHLDASIKFMHVSAPVRVMERAEWAPVGLREFGLDPPGFVVTLYRGQTRVLEAAFGAVNPQQVLQYMRLTGHDQVYLMSRFIGAEWEQLIRDSRG
jgi:hypothetical protein